MHCCIVLYCIVLYCIVLYCIVYIVLYCIMKFAHGNLLFTRTHDSSCSSLFKPSQPHYTMIAHLLFIVISSNLKLSFFILIPSINITDKLASKLSWRYLGITITTLYN